MIQNKIWEPANLKKFRASALRLKKRNENLSSAVWGNNRLEKAGSWPQKSIPTNVVGSWNRTWVAWNQADHSSTPPKKVGHFKMPLNFKNQIFFEKKINQFNLKPRKINFSLVKKKFDPELFRLFWNNEWQAGHRGVISGLFRQSLFSAVVARPFKKNFRLEFFEIFKVWTYEFSML